MNESALLTAARRVVLARAALLTAEKRYEALHVGISEASREKHLAYDEATAAWEELSRLLDPREPAQ